MRVSIIVAAARNGVIGLGGDIPWKLPADQKFFRKQTTGHAIIIGRKTFDSIGRPLPGRRNLVLTRGKAAPVAGIDFFPSLVEALDWARDEGLEECFIAGGEAIYREGLALADRVYLTRVDAEPEGDTYFPDLPAAEWKQVGTIAHATDERHKHAFSIETWDRVR
ncbi:MAG: dihydrofolate reductase [Myxococcota bacterium]